MIRLLALTALSAALLAPPAAEAGCRSNSCEERVAHAKWRKVVAPHRSVLAANAQCESGGRYNLYTTGSGYYYSHQFDAAAWLGSGGRSRRGRLVGRFSTQPGRLEQDYRAVIWDRRHGGDPWPNCPFG